MVETRVYNFSAGPATLPLPVMEQVQRELLVYPGAGASIMEISHRSKTFAAVHAQTKANIRSLLGVGDDYHVLFISGGATMQFTMLAMNLLGGKSGDYIHSGSWASKAINDAKRQGDVRVVWNGKEENFNRMPTNADLELNPDAAYLHFTSNETIQGTEFFTEPDAREIPLICDASSDFLSQPLNMAKYGMIYAGAQKNVGPSGMAVAVIRDDMLARVPENLPPLLDYKLLAKKDSLYNTPPSFTIYIVGLVTKWLLDEFGSLEAVEAFNIKKAAVLYDAIDASGGYYKGHAVPECRSRMNVTFRLPSEELEAKFVAEATAAGMHGLKGHRSVGGCRASIYNAMTIDGVETLRDFMTQFQQNNG